MDRSGKADFFCQVSSNKDENYLTAAIYNGEYFICTVDTEFGEFGVSYYSGGSINYNQPFMHGKLDDFLRILEVVKSELRKYPNRLHVK